MSSLYDPATHEAGHAVIGYRLGISIAYATVKPGEGANGHVTYGRPGIDGNWPLKAQITNALAGCAAAMRYRGDVPSVDGLEPSEIIRLLRSSGSGHGSEDHDLSHALGDIKREYYGQYETQGRWGRKTVTRVPISDRPDAMWRILKDHMNDALTLAMRNMPEIIRVADALSRHETLSGIEIAAIADGGYCKSPR